MHGWVAYVEDCVIRWIDTRPIGRDELLDLLTASLPAVAAVAGEETSALAAVLTPDASD